MSPGGVKAGQCGVLGSAGRGFGNSGITANM